MKGGFDPRHVDKYIYRIPVAPFVAVSLILFLNFVGFVLSPSTTGGGGGIPLLVGLANPNFYVIVVLSFLFGFFGKRSLDFLDQVWQRLLPGDSKEREQATSGNIVKSSGAETE